MSVRCISQVLEKSVHSGTALLMLVVLADYSDDEGNSYPAVASLARKCRMQPRNANYILKELQDSGELRVLKNEGPRGTNRYRIMLALLGAKPLQRSAPLQGIAPLQWSAPTPAMECAKPLQPIADEPSLNRQEPSVRETSQSEYFNAFYASYPRKVGKKAAIKAFKAAKVGKQLLQSILADIDRRMSVGEWTLEKAQFIPHPATYLNNHRWMDEATPNQLATNSPMVGAI